MKTQINPKAVRKSLVNALAVGVCTIGVLSLSIPTSMASSLPGAGKTIQPIATGRADQYFQHFIVQIGLEKLGYTVGTHLEAQYPAMHLTIGQGEADYTAVHWNPLHGVLSNMK